MHDIIAVKLFYRSVRIDAELLSVAEYKTHDSYLFFSIFFFPGTGGFFNLFRFPANAKAGARKVLPSIRRLSKRRFVAFLSSPARRDLLTATTHFLVLPPARRAFSPFSVFFAAATPAPRATIFGFRSRLQRMLPLYTPAGKKSTTCALFLKGRRNDLKKRSLSPLFPFGSALSKIVSKRRGLF